MSNKKLDPKTLTDREKLELLYVQFLKISHKTVSMKFDYISEVSHYIEKTLSQYMFKLYGFTELPQVISDQDYKNLQARELFRGVDNVDYHAELLCSPEYYHSYWHNGIGIFCTTKPELAADYFTQNHGTDYVLKFKYTGKTLDRINDKSTNFLYYMALKYGDYNSINDKNIIKKCQTFREFIADKQSNVPNVTGISRQYAELRGKQDFAELISVHDSFMPPYLGFDSFDFDVNKIHFPEIVIQNRGKMVVSLSEYNRICKASQNYKHCVKTEADLATEPQPE